MLANRVRFGHSRRKEQEGGPLVLYKDKEGFENFKKWGVYYLLQSQFENFKLWFSTTSNTLRDGGIITVDPIDFSKYTKLIIEFALLSFPTDGQAFVTTSQTINGITLLTYADINRRVEREIDISGLEGISNLHLNFRTKAPGLNFNVYKLILEE